MGNFSIFHWIIVAGIVYGLWRVLKKKTKSPLHPPNELATHETPGKTDPTHQEDRPDHWEGAFWDVENPRPADITINLLYKDGAGQRTKRTVHVTGFDTDPSGIMIGHCMLRNERRTFRFDRIERAIDPETGEVIGDVHAWLDEKQRNSPQGMAASLVENNADLIKVLLYMAKADGTMRAAEISEIATTAAAITGNENINASVANSALRMLDAPTLQGFKQAFGRIRNTDSAVALKVVEAAHRIVATQKTVHPNEQVALDYLMQAMNKTSVKH